MTYFTFVVFRSLSLVSSGKTHFKKYGTFTLIFLIIRRGVSEIFENRDLS